MRCYLIIDIGASSESGRRLALPFVISSCFAFAVPVVLQAVELGAAAPAHTDLDGYPPQALFCRCPPVFGRGMAPLLIPAP